MVKMSESSKTILRIDDISMNISQHRLEKFLERVRNKHSDLEFLLAVSPAVFEMPTSDEADISERIFPSILNAHSDHRVFYRVEKIGIPKWIYEIAQKYDARLASHGLIHVDHRLLDFSAQEMSIITSTSLIGSKIFVPPFNKYNNETSKICSENNIELIKWEDGWKHLSYQGFSNDGSRYYMHLHDFPGDKLASLFK
ncbi:hypothetical protein MCEMKE157_01341 [actinobacterium SCGC AAA044-D11]